MTVPTKPTRMSGAAARSVSAEEELVVDERICRAVSSICDNVGTSEGPCHQHCYRIPMRNSSPGQAALSLREHHAAPILEDIGVHCTSCATYQFIHALHMTVHSHNQVLPT